MCGIAGFFGPSLFGADIFSQTLSEMSKSISSRGPDDAGIWFHEASGVGLAHRRLSIVDLSAAGKQPMESPSGRFVIIYNGEIYNHNETRRELEGAYSAPAWRGHSDTETLLAACEIWGIEQALKRSVGMFAFAIWDREKRELTLARDRVGEKPLYYGWFGEGQSAVFLFGSELKALKPHPSFVGGINRNAITLLLRHNYIPAPHTIYENVFKLLPGSFLTIRIEDICNKPTPVRYWSLPEVAVAQHGQHSNIQPGEIVSELHTILKMAVGQQMVADVPLGAFLSGGIDSSLVVSMMQSQSGRPVKTFTIGFEEDGYNEAGYAKKVAEHLGTDHTELYVTSEEAMSVIPQLPVAYDEPFSDSSQIPTLLVSRLARQQVTVSLSGDGGDELFCGYTRYLATEKAWNRLSLLPQPARHALAKGIQAVSPTGWDKLAHLLPLRDRTLGGHRLGDKLHKAASVLASKSVDSLYLGMVSHWADPEAIVLNATEPRTQLSGLMPELQSLNDVERMMVLDMMSYLPDDILTKVDRAAMSASLETRVPLLDHRLIEFAWSVPHSMKLNGGETKWILREILSQYIPKSHFDRPKMGFGIPLDRWLRGPLKEWAEDLLSEDRLRREGYFDPAPIQRKWREHLSGSRNWAYHLWDVLMFQSWQESQFG